MTVPGLSTTSVKVLVASAWFLRVTFGRGDADRLLVGAGDIVGRDLRGAGTDQVDVGAVEDAGCAKFRPSPRYQVPGFSVMVPRSRFCSEVSSSGLTMFAVTVAFWVAAVAGSARAAADQAAASADIAALVGHHPSCCFERRSGWTYRRNGLFSVNHDLANTPKKKGPPSPATPPTWRGAGPLTLVADLLIIGGQREGARVDAVRVSCSER